MVRPQSAASSQQQAAMAASRGRVEYKTAERAARPQSAMAASRGRGETKPAEARPARPQSAVGVRSYGTRRGTKPSRSEN
eukprot:809980-Prorocentrum_minimum.AAC.1